MPRGAKRSREATSCRGTARLYSVHRNCPMPRDTERPREVTSRRRIATLQRAEKPQSTVSGLRRSVRISNRKSKCEDGRSHYDINDDVESTSKKVMNISNRNTQKSHIKNHSVE